LHWPWELTTKKTSLLSQPTVAIKNKQFFLLLSLPSNNLETDHKENTSRGVYCVFPSGFTILIYYFNTLYFGRWHPRWEALRREKLGNSSIRPNPREMKLYAIKNWKQKTPQITPWLKSEKQSAKVYFLFFILLSNHVLNWRLFEWRILKHWLLIQAEVYNIIYNVVYPIRL
jgi:hypothetical protein